MRGRHSTKLFGIGLGRTGSKSLAAAMHILGFRSKHAPKDFNDIHQHDFLSDIRVSWQFKFLDYVYYNAKFILTIREIEEWIESNKKWSPGRDGGEAEKGTPGMLLSRFYCYETCHFEEDVFRAAYYRHQDDVIKHFSTRPDKLLIMNICRGDGWEKLCPFVGKYIPSVAFPWQHQTR